MRELHAFLSNHSIYSALLATGVAVGLLAFRFHWSGVDTFAFLAWNLALAWIPFAASLLVSVVARAGGRAALVPPLLAWFVFFPNAPYVLTDFVHLRERASMPLWFDVALMAAFAGAGLWLGIASLAHVQDSLARIRPWLGWLVVAAAVPATGLGIWIGRWLRFNSWDLATRPDAVLRDVVGPFLSPADHPTAIGVTLVYAALFGVAYAALRPPDGSMIRAERAR